MFTLELKLFHAINKGCVNAVFDWFAFVSTVIGEYEFALAFALFLVLALRKEKKMIGLVLLEGLLVSGFVVFIFKTGCLRVAPSVALENVRRAVIETDMRSCFPSGHATCSFLTATVLSCYFRRGYLLFYLAAAIALSRVYNGVHYVSDVLAGAMIGVITGYVVVYAARKTDKLQRFFIKMVSGD